jgi:hypothetical protein
LAWQEAQFAKGRTVPDLWHTVQRGADDTGEEPETAWQGAQLPSKAS